MLDFTPAITEWKTLCKTTWPEVSGVWDAEHISMVPWDRLVLPYAVVLLPSLQRADDQDSVNLLYYARPTFIYVAQTTGKATLFRQKLSELADALWPVNPADAGPFTYSQVFEVGSADWSDEFPVNGLFRDANRQQRAGGLMAKILLGEEL